MGIGINPYAEDDYALEEALPEERFEAAESAGGSAQSKNDRELREELVGRLDHLEKALKAYSEWRHQRGHNHPPELVEDEPLTQVDLDQAFSAVEQLREEAEKEEPDTEIIIAASSSLGSFSGRLKSAAVFLGLAAVAGPVGNAVTEAIRWSYQNHEVLYEAATHAAQSSARWCQHVIGLF